jgi:hypothetical protein
MIYQNNEMHEITKQGLSLAFHFKYGDIDPSYGYLSAYYHVNNESNPGK